MSRKAIKRHVTAFSKGIHTKPLKFELAAVKGPKLQRYKASMLK